MVETRTKLGLVLVATGFAILCASLGGLGMFPGAQPSRQDRQHPVAALAWSEANCESQMSLVPGTPGLQMEDLLELSSAFDELERREGHEKACLNAEKLAKAVAATADFPERRPTALAAAFQSR